jgi:hypothetical protein
MEDKFDDMWIQLKTCCFIEENPKTQYDGINQFSEVNNNSVEFP